MRPHVEYSVVRAYGLMVHTVLHTGFSRVTKISLCSVQAVTEDRVFSLFYRVFLLFFKGTFIGEGIAFEWLPGALATLYTEHTTSCRSSAPLPPNKT